MTESLQTTLKTLPTTPGVYFHKDAKGDILYIGKAANLRNRVRQYFQNSRTRDPKTEALVAEIADVEWREVDTELDALFLEAELIRRYLPPYNILLRDDKSLAFVRISIKSEHPTVTITRRPLDDDATYLGPYYSAVTVRRALKALRKPFPYSTHRGVKPKRACLQAHLGLCPGIEEQQTSIDEYRSNLKKLMKYLRAERSSLMKELEAEMKEFANNSQFEKAAKIRNQLFALKHLSKQIVFSDSESLDISKDYGLTGLADLLGLGSIPKRIEGYDISHMQGTDTVASMVVFGAGIPDKSSYRKFKMQIPGNDDFIHMHEVITRRLKPRNVKAWGIPDLVLIDGGKGQLSAALRARDEAGQTMPMVGLAKREEEIVIAKSSSIHVNDEVLNELHGFKSESDDFVLVALPHTSHIVKLLQRIRDESHRFAVSYHSTLKQHRQTVSALDEIPGIGPKTKRKLIVHFGGFKRIVEADVQQLEKVVSHRLAKTLYENLSTLRKKG